MEGRIEVRLFAYLRDGRGRRLYLEEKTVRSILKTLKIESDEISILLINGRDGLLDTPLKEGDVVSLFPPVGGG
ncbi:molybdopterin synthase sulfur carrier subunit [endosymbiont 'TC1' of Trimyema compressum]|nr:MoaD/ThiS family protein [endosymbiont 'TC1' of Trimyema compressum]AMP21400.1 molybdopterin synthase sulfur carrier subunit [endosymbiont 'TC1' of Trimyema compressum]